MKTYTIRYISFTEIKFNKPYLLSLLPEERKNKILSFKNDAEQYLSIAMNYFVSKYVKGEVTRTKEGKLKTPKGYFTITYSGEYVIFVETKELSGLALEKRTDKKEDIINYAFNDIDKKLIKTANDFYYLWSLKEALMNALGKNFNQDDIKTLESKEGNVSYLDKNFYLKSEIFKDYYIALCIEGKNDFNIKLQEETIG